MRLDDRIPYLINCNLQQNTRSFFILLGQNAQVNLPVLLQIYAQKCMHQPKLLWCYSEKQDFKHFMKQFKQNSDEQKSILEQKNVRFVHYRDLDQILGTTFSCLILQDFKALTPNGLAKTVETVRGGGLVILLINEIEDLQQICGVKMDCQRKYVNAGQDACVSRFNERFLKKLQQCDNLLVMDQKLNVLEVSEHIKQMKDKIGEVVQKTIYNNEELLRERKNAAESGDPIASALSKIACTSDQCSLLLQILGLFKSQKGVEVLAKQQDEEQSEKSEDLADETAEKLTAQERRERRQLEKLKKTNKKGYENLLSQIQANKASTVVQPVTSIFPQNQTIFLTAARGRGKSALSGLLTAAAVANQATNVLIFAPNASNVQTLFEFALKGLEALNYVQQVDYSVQKEGSKELDNIVQVHIYKQYRQTIQYVPFDSFSPSLLQFADLIVVDEAAAMPLSVTRQILSCSAFTVVSSTVHGYEGSGRALQVKIIEQLQRRPGVRRCELREPIRYGRDDALERFLYDALLLDAQEDCGAARAFPPLSSAQLFMVSRDALFSGDAAAEAFLRRIWAVFVQSHYKNQPNDLQLLSDSPNQRILVLLDAASLRSDFALVQPLCCIQLAFEGQIEFRNIKNGNLAPYLLAQQFCAEALSQMPSVRVVRIAVPQLLQDRGYGGVALQQLEEFCGAHRQNTTQRVDRDMPGYVPQAQLPPLLFRLNQLQMDEISYISVAFGCSLPLAKFYFNHQYKMLYLKSTCSEETGERSCLVVKPLGDKAELFGTLAQDFGRRVFRQADIQFAGLEIEQIFSILQQCQFKQAKFTLENVQGSDLLRVQAYVQRKIDFNSIADLAKLVGQDVYLKNNAFLLTEVQKRVLCGICCQRKTFKAVADELKLKKEQCEAIFVKGLETILVEYQKIEGEENMMLKKMK